MMKREHVRDWMTVDPVIVDPDLSVSSAYALMRKNHIRQLPVIGAVKESEG